MRVSRGVANFFSHAQREKSLPLLEVASASGQSVSHTTPPSSLLSWFISSGLVLFWHLCDRSPSVIFRGATGLLFFSRRNMVSLRFPSSYSFCLAVLFVFALLLQPLGYVEACTCWFLVSCLAFACRVFSPFAPLSRLLFPCVLYNSHLRFPKVPPISRIAALLLRAPEPRTLCAALALTCAGKRQPIA